MKKLTSERGQSLVEMAISLVVLLWLLAGAVEFGLAYFQFIQLRDAAQEGALYGSINPIASGETSGAKYDAIRNRILSQSTSPIDLSNEYYNTGNVRIDITVSGSGCITDAITVVTYYDHKTFMPFANLFMNDVITIHASVTDTILSSTNTGC